MRVDYVLEKMGIKKQELAEILGVTPAMITYAVRKNGGHLTELDELKLRYEIAPDIFGPRTEIPIRRKSAITRGINSRTGEKAAS